MNWIILIGNENFNLSCIRAVNYIGSIAAYDVKDIPNRFCVEYPKDHIFYDVESDLTDYNDTLKNIPISSPNVIMMSYSSSSLIRTVITQSDFPKDIYIDNTAGIVLPIEEFIRKDIPLDQQELNEQLDKSNN